MTTETPKKKGKKSLMSIPADYRKVIYQPNHVTNSQYSYTLIQERIFNYIIFHLNTYTKKVMDGLHVKQLEIFTKEADRDYIDIVIPLHIIAKHYQYDEVRERAKEMIALQVCMEVKDWRGEKWLRTQGLLTHVDEKPGENRRSGTLPVRMSKDVAMLLLNVERDNGQPISYTSFMFDVALGAENKYTPRIYKLLCSWKKKAMYRCTLEEFREFLQVGKKYKDYEALKRRIITPVQQELKDKADFYFEISETREANKKVVKLNFILKFPKDEASTDLSEYKLWNNIDVKLERIFGVNLKWRNVVKSKLQGRCNPVEVTETMKTAFEFINQPNKKIGDAAHYIVKILLRDFSTK